MAERITVILTPELADRLSTHCTTNGFKKSTLIARLIREYLEQLPQAPQLALPLGAAQDKRRKRD